MPPQQPLLKVITATTVFDGEAVFAGPGGVVVAGNQIVAVGDHDALAAFVGSAAVERQHFEGCTLLPGLIDAHVHLIMPGRGQSIIEWSSECDETLLLVASANAAKALYAGVTTVVDLGGKGSITFRLRDAVERGLVPGPRLVLCGRALTMTGGHGWPWEGEADGVDGVRLAVRQLCKEGADLIKVMVTGGGTPGTRGTSLSYSSAELEALVQEAHERGRLVFAHCTATEGIRQAHLAGIDVIVHGQFIGADGQADFDDDLCEAMAHRGVAFNPTLAVNSVLRSRVPRDALAPDHLALLDAWIDRYVDFERDVRRLREHGIRLICGSDCGWGWLEFGETHVELIASVSAGLTIVEALRSATGHAADAIGLGELTGRLLERRRADLLVVRGNVSVDIATVREVEAVWLDGRRVGADTSGG